MAIIINDKHSLNDYGMWLSETDIGVPAPKTNYIDIVGGDGSLDFTEAFGKVNYSNRQMTFKFSKDFYSAKERDDFKGFIINELDGLDATIVLEQDPDFEYRGRISLSFSRSKNVLKIDMKVNANPYKLKRNKTVISVDGDGVVSLTNLKKHCVPTITTTAETKIIHNGIEINLSAGRAIVPEFELFEGSNVFEVFSTGETTFEYQEGAL